MIVVGRLAVPLRVGEVDDDRLQCALGAAVDPDHLTGAGRGEAVTGALDAVALSSLQDTPVRLLSQGQKRRLALARLMVANSVVWLLDEPTVGLDSESLGAIESKLADHRAAGGIVVVSTHSRIKLPDAATIALEDYAVLRAVEMIW